MACCENGTINRTLIVTIIVIKTKKLYTTLIYENIFLYKYIAYILKVVLFMCIFEGVTPIFQLHFSTSKQSDTI